MEIRRVAAFVLAVVSLTIVAHERKWAVPHVWTVILINTFLFSTLAFIFFEDGSMFNSDSEEDEEDDEDFDPKEVKYIEKKDRKEELERNSGSESDGSSSSSDSNSSSGSWKSESVSNLAAADGQSA